MMAVLSEGGEVSGRYASGGYVCGWGEGGCLQVRG